MAPQCYPISTLPGTTPLFRDFADNAAAAQPALLRRWYPANPFSMDWASHSPMVEQGQRTRLADALRGQAESFGAGEPLFANIERLKNGAAIQIHTEGSRVTCDDRTLNGYIPVEIDAAGTVRNPIRVTCTN